MGQLFLENYGFWIAQCLGAVGAVLMYIRMDKKDRKDFYRYHTYFCIPMAMQFVLLNAWLMASFCIVGAIRTLLLSTDWGWEKRTLVVLGCLSIPVSGSIVTASTTMDWVLLGVTAWAIASELSKSFLSLRVASFVCTFTWFLNSLLFGGYVNAMAQAAALISNAKAMERDFMFSERVREFLTSRSPALASGK